MGRRKASREFGMWLDEGEAEAFCDAYAMDPATMVEPGRATWDVARDVAYDAGGTWLGNPEIDGVEVVPFRTGEVVEGAKGMLLLSGRQGSVLASDAGSLYRDASEMARELEGRFGRWLPAGLDVASHLAEESHTSRA